MCGVFGYIGQPTQIVPMVADALRIMEYRGYDSWGIGWDSGESVSLLKHTGRVPATLTVEATASIAIGHTRWATHGAVTDANAHPHTDSTGQIAVVHNGVIENAGDLRSGLEATVQFLSETDSEIIPHLIRRYMNSGASFVSAVRRTFLQLEGSSALLAMDRVSGVMVAVTARTPLRLGRRTDGWELASDPLACARLSHEIAVIPDHHLIVLTPNTAQLLDVHAFSEVALAWEPTPEETSTSRGDFPHFTLKEILDQVAVARELIERSADVDPLAAAIRCHRHVILTGCGSAFHAASLGAQWLARATDTWIDVVPASEIDDHTRNLGNDSLVIALTQSGETADVVDAIRVAQHWGATTAAVLNTESSTVAGMVDTVIAIRAGVERSVLATKSMLAMAIRLYQTAASLHPTGFDNLDQVPDAITEVLQMEVIPRIATKISESDSMIILGKGIGRAVAQEAALKIKEGSYSHAEAFLTGELKHGPLALVRSGLPCVVLATSPAELRSATIAVAEVTSRGGQVIGVGAFDEDACVDRIPVDSCHDWSGLVHLVAMQVLAYHVAILRGVDPDFPRNLAKSVTVR